MNPYKDGGPRARLSFVPAYCKRCTAPPSVNDGYIARRPPRTDAPPAAHAERHARIAFDAWDFCMRQRAATGGRATACAAPPAPAGRRVLGPVRAAATRYRRD